MDTKAIIARLIQAKRNILESKFCHSSRSPTSPTFCPVLVRDDIRLLVIRDSEPSKKTLYDSKVDCKPPTYQRDGKRVVSRSRTHKTCKLQPKHQDADSKGEKDEASSKEKVKRQADTQLYGEMIFGSAPMTQASLSLKVHIVRSPPQLMVTRVFTPIPESREVSGEQESFDLWSLQSLVSDAGSGPRQIYSFDKSSVNIAHSVPVDVPSSPRQSDLEHDSGISASVASSSSSSCMMGFSGGSSSPVGTGSLSSLTRRLKRSKTTSLEQLSRRNTDSIEPLTGNRRPPRYGIGIIFSLPEEDSDSFKHFEKFFFSHITLIESHVLRLRSEVDKALHAQSRHLVSEAFEIFRDAFSNLYCTPRLPDPVWLGLMTTGTHQMALCHNFLRDFMAFVEKWDTKSTKFFVSTLITAVLTHHLAWVPTVMPSRADKSSSNPNQQNAKWVVHTLGKSHPYNPLWAQLSDLYGAVGFPLQMSRTIVTGKRQDIVMKLLHILSYFIRCSHVAENTELREPFDIMSDKKGSDERIVSQEVDTPRLRSGSSESPLLSANSNKSTNTIQGALFSSMQASTETVTSDKVYGNDDLTYNIHNQIVQFKPISEDSEMGLDSDEPLSDFCAECGLKKVCEGDEFEYTVGQSVFYCNYDTSEEPETCKCHKLDPIFQTNECYSRLSLNASSSAECDSNGCDLERVDEGAYVSQLHPRFLFRHPDSLIPHDDMSEDPYSLLSLSTDCSCDTANTSLASLPHHYHHQPPPAMKSTLITVTSSNNISATDRVPFKSDSIHEDNNFAVEKLVRVTLSNKSLDQPQSKSVNLMEDMDSQRLQAEQLATPLTAMPCQVSPNEVLEEIKVVHERHFGRQCDIDSQNTFVFDDCKLLPNLLHEPKKEKHDSGLYSRGGSAANSPRVKSCLEPMQNMDDRGDSGMFEDSIELPQPLDTPVNPETSKLHPHPTNASDETTLESETETPVTLHKQLSLKHSGSIFDEYFPDDIGSVLPSPSHLKPQSCERSISVESSSSLAAQLSDIELPSLTVLHQLQMGTINQDSKDQPLRCMDEYFEDGAPPVLGPMQSPVVSNKHLETSDLSAPAKENEDEEDYDQDFRSRVTSVGSLGSVFSRQNSQLSDNTKAQYRSLTPTEYGRRRHTSAASSIFSNNSENAVITENLKEVTMPSFGDDDSGCDYNFGHSLFAGYSEHYLSDFVLHGTSDSNFMSHLHQDLTYAVQNPVVDERISEAICIVADTDKWTVRVKSCQYATSDRVKEHDVVASQLVSNIIDSVHELWKLKMAPEFCLMHLEDRLQEIYFHSRSLSQCRRSQRKVPLQDLTSMLGFDTSDLPLLMAAAGTHTQNLCLVANV